MYWTEFFTIALAHLLAVASPGPDFAIVTRQTVSSGTEAGLWTSAGVGLGILLHVSYCILGVALLLTQTPALFTAMKWIAAIYLAYLGGKALRSAFKQQAAPAATGRGAVASPVRALTQGFLTNGLNPKATLFFLALFTLVISPQTPVRVQVLYGLYLAMATFAWFALLTLFLGRPPVRSLLLRAGHWFEAAMGLVLIALALQLLWGGLGGS